MAVDEQMRTLYRDRIRLHDQEQPGYAARWTLWRNRLVQLGGVEVVPPLSPEFDLDNLLLSAVLHDRPVITVAGEPRNCHGNSAALFVADQTPNGDPVASIGTGYARNGALWRQHSWALGPDGTIYETTTPRDAYVGLVLDDQAAYRFVVANT